MTVSQYDHVVPYTDLGGRGYFGVNAALVTTVPDTKSFTTPTLWRQELLQWKSCVSLPVKAKHGRHIMWFTNIKSNLNMSRSHWKCSSVHTYRLNQSKWTFSTQISEGALCFSQGWMGYSAWCLCLLWFHRLIRWGWGKTFQTTFSG